MATKYVKYRPVKAICPGETIKETIEYLEITPEAFADKLDITVEELSDLLQGSIPLTCELANKLQEITNTPARIWISLEKRYRDVQEMLSRTPQSQLASV